MYILFMIKQSKNLKRKDTEMEIGKLWLSLELEYKKMAIDENLPKEVRDECNKKIALIKQEIKNLGL